MNSRNLSTETGKIELSRKEGIVTLTLSHQRKLNAISVAMWKSLTHYFTTFSEDARIRCVIISGEGGNFAAGADIEEFREQRKDFESVLFYHQQILAPALQAIGSCPHPVIAKIEGVCVGGGLEIACQCDLRIAADNARFGAPINQLGFPMAPEELRGVLAVAGRAIALELLLEGQILTAKEALAKGLLTRIVAPDDLDGEIQQCVTHLLKGSPQAARINKKTLNWLTPTVAPLTEAELQQFYAAWSESADHREGVAAFLEKRQPKFLDGIIP